MLKKITINGFKSIKSAELEFGKVNVFIGGNGAGKSNVLEAIGVLSAALDRDISDAELQKKGVRLSIPTLFKSAFKNSTFRVTFDLKARFSDNVGYDVGITAGDSSDTLRFFSEHIRHRGTSYMGRSNHGIRVMGISGVKQDIAPIRGVWDRFRETVALPPELLSELNKMGQYAIYSPQTAFLRGTDVESVPIKPIGLQGGGLPQAANTLLKDLRTSSPQIRTAFLDILNLFREPGWTDTFIIRPTDHALVSSQVKTGEATLYFRDKYMRTTRNILSAYDSSEGTLYLLFATALLLHKEAPKQFAIDNVDSALNPAMTRRLIETVISVVGNDDFHKVGIGPEQVFLTSHNPTAIDAIDIFNDDHRIFVVMRDEHGATTISPLRPPKGLSKADWIEKAQGKNLSELWIEGKIKGALGL